MRTYVAIALGCASIAWGQEILRGTEPGRRPILFNGDMAVLEAGEARKDLACTVTPEKPVLGFDLRFHAGYSIDLPLKELEGPGDMLSILFRVIPKGAGDPVYFSQQIRVPAISETSGGVNLGGVFDLGEGSYHVDWLMRNFGGRYCASQWDVEVALSPKDKQVAVALPALAVRRSEDEQFQPEPPVQRAGEAPLNIKVLLNFAPQRPDAAALDPVDTAALVSILRNLSRNPRIAKFSVVAFNIQEQRVLFRQEASDRIDFPAMGRAVKAVHPGTVDVQQLGNKHGGTEFLSSLMKTELGESNPDGLIFIGPKAMLDQSVPEVDLKEIGEVDYPVFYMNYTPDPQAVPWKDTISRMVKFFKGREYTISGPRDLWNAVSEVVARIAKAKQIKGTGPLPTGAEQVR